MADIEKAERDKMRAKVNAIIDHGINCFVNRQLIYNFPEEIFADAGIMAIEHADFDGIERLALVTGKSQSALRLCLLHSPPDCYAKDLALSSFLYHAAPITFVRLLRYRIIQCLRDDATSKIACILCRL